MSKLFIAVLAISTVSLSMGHEAFGIDAFLDNPKIKLLSNPGVKGAYPGTNDINYDELLKALAAVQEPVTVEKVMDVLREHALKLYMRVKYAEDAFIVVRDSITNPDAKNFVAKVGQLIEKYYLVGLLINEQAKEGEELHKLYDGLSDEAKKMVGKKLKEAANDVEKTLYKQIE